MLYRETVSTQLLGLLKRLMGIDELTRLRLVGGTALALQIGHRNSVDIDLFWKHDMDENTIAGLLQVFKPLKRLGGSRSIQVFLINDIKVDFVNYPYPWLQPPVVEEGIRMASIEDIAAMKIAAITQRGSRKDFIDLYFLLQRFELAEILKFYKKKMTDGNEWLALRSMSYFDDADQQPSPAMFQDIEWLEIKTYISKAVEAYGGY